MLGCPIETVSSACNKQHSKEVFTFFGHVHTCSSSVSIAWPLWGFIIFCLHIMACIFSFMVISVVLRLPFGLEVGHKRNTLVEPTTQTAAEKAVGGIQKHSNDELHIIPSKLSVTFPITGVPSPLPPSQLVMLPSGFSHPLPLGAQAHGYSRLTLLSCCG